MKRCQLAKFKPDKIIKLQWYNATLLKFTTYLFLLPEFLYKALVFVCLYVANNQVFNIRLLYCFCTDGKLKLVTNKHGFLMTRLY